MKSKITLAVTIVIGVMAFGIGTTSFTDHAAAIQNMCAVGQFYPTDVKCDCPTNTYKENTKSNESYGVVTWGFKCVSGSGTGGGGHVILGHEILIRDIGHLMLDGRRWILELQLQDAEPMSLSMSQDQARQLIRVLQRGPMSEERSHRSERRD